MDGSAKAFADLVTGPEKKKITNAAKRQFGQKIQGIPSVQSAHSIKIHQAISIYHNQKSPMRHGAWVVFCINGGS
jgi:hypothetical protein